MRTSLYFLLAAITASASCQVLQTKTYATTGHPTEAVETSDGQYVLVTVDRGKGESGIDVFHLANGTLDRVAYQPLGMQNAQGIVQIPHTHTLAVGMSNAGVAFLPVDEAIKGTATPKFLHQGEKSGSGYLAVTPDGQTLFVANEYGDGGNVGVIALHRDEEGNIHPQTLAHLPAPRTTPGVAISPDGAWMFAEGEVVPPDFADKLPGHDVQELRHGGCTQGGPQAKANGALYVFNVAKASALTQGASSQEVNATRAGWTDAGCSPVRETLSADGSLLYVTARGDDRILVFNAKGLESGSSSALMASFPSGGNAPIGLKLFDGDKMLLVANSDRFSGGKGSASVIDVSDPKKAKVKQKIKTGDFPRNITASADGKTLYMAIFLGDELMVLREK